MNVTGTVRVPGDKSISHRSLLFSALADGRSRIRNILPSADVHSTAGVLRTLGVAVPELSADISIVGRGLGSLRAPSADLECGNSGTTTRLVSGIAAACPFTSRFIGDASLSRRPMRRVARPLTAMGARFEFEHDDGLPMVIHGAPLHAVEWTTNTASAQTKSAILLAGLVAGVPVTVREPARSRDHTERMLGAMGVRIETGTTGVHLDPAQRLEPLDMSVPSDPSSAAFMAALAFLADDGALAIPMVCLNETRTGFFRAVAGMGARVDLCMGEPQGGEPVGTVVARASQLEAITLDPAEVPSMIDELPLLACLAARAHGTTTITGAAELRVKESDRIATTVANLRALGVEADELPDGMRVTGGRAPLRGAIRTHGDHRIAMAFGILGALPGNAIAIDDRACVAVSYPTFWDDLQRAIVG
ncbi:MAG TPA: 3-phosphoshikimate 1-carboxyvinyltransferase [Gemmatimonadaceae bacterium]|jgi:3-phosphoshikimate 1-carboxyvinyltransferase|nr:3-phosphoshikimate 1-carboxyvinyltransferase [Gemmatimonadaceae bacterium]